MGLKRGHAQRTSGMDCHSSLPAPLLQFPGAPLPQSGRYGLGHYDPLLLQVPCPSNQRNNPAT